MVYQASGFLQRESDASKQSYHVSPGLVFASRTAPDLNTMECAPVVVIQDTEERKIRDACLAFVRACQPALPRSSV